MDWEIKFYDEKDKGPYNTNVEWAEKHEFEIDDAKQEITVYKFFENKRKHNYGFLYKLLINGEKAYEINGYIKNNLPELPEKELCENQVMNCLIVYATDNLNYLMQRLEEIKKIVA